MYIHISIYTHTYMYTYTYTYIHISSMAFKAPAYRAAGRLRAPFWRDSLRPGERLHRRRRARLAAALEAGLPQMRAHLGDLVLCAGLLLDENPREPRWMWATWAWTATSWSKVTSTSPRGCGTQRRSATTQLGDLLPGGLVAEAIQYIYIYIYIYVCVYIYIYIYVFVYT